MKITIEVSDDVARIYQEYFGLFQTEIKSFIEQTVSGKIIRCINCGRVFIRTRDDRKYCSRKCLNCYAQRKRRNRLQ